MAIVSLQDTRAAAISIGGITGSGSQSIPNMTIGDGPNITGSVSVRNTRAKELRVLMHMPDL
jgi:hypothetical protein